MTRHGSDTNLYSFEGSNRRCHTLRKEKLAEREKRKQAEAERLTRKRPKFTVVSDNDE
jgi:hypothetical protein